MQIQHGLLQIFITLQAHTGAVSGQLNPSRHSETVARYYHASPQQVSQAIDAALQAKPSWESMPFADRAAVFLKAAELLSTKYRYEVMAWTIKGQGKNAWQAEIDAAAELCDFLRYDPLPHASTLQTKR